MALAFVPVSRFSAVSLFGQVAVFVAPVLALLAIATTAFGGEPLRLSEEELSLRCCYEQEVAWIACLTPRLLAAGYTPKSVALAAHGLRREIGLQYKAATSPKALAIIQERNREKYGDPAGPTIDYLRARGDSWRQIAASAGRTGGGDLVTGRHPCCFQSWVDATRAEP